MRGTMAPPMMPVTIIPEKEPWCSLTEFRASEKIIGYITEAKNPIQGNAISEIFAEPKSATLKNMRARTVKMIKTFLLSIIFIKIEITANNQYREIQGKFDGTTERKMASDLLPVSFKFKTIYEYTNGLKNDAPPNINCASTELNA